MNRLLILILIPFLLGLRPQPMMIGNGERIKIAMGFPYTKEQIVEAVRSVDVGEIPSYGYSIVMIKLLEALGEKADLYGLESNIFFYCLKTERWGFVEVYPGDYLKNRIVQIIPREEWKDDIVKFMPMVIKALEKLSGMVSFKEIDKEVERLRKSREGI